jgi:hypothetical protein
MRKPWVFGMFVLVVLFAAGCTAEIVVPITYGSAIICSGRPGIYGELYVDGDYAGYLEPNECLTVSGLALGRWHTARLYHPWGGVYVRDFYLDYSGKIVTID